MSCPTRPGEKASSSTRSPTRLPPDRMPLTKLSLSIGDADLADKLSELLAELEPPPLAVSHFRAVGMVGWVVEVYYAHAPDVEQVASACSRLAPGWSGKIA